MGWGKGKQVEFVVRPAEAEREWNVEGVPVLRAYANLPDVPDGVRQWKRIRSFYRLQNRLFFRYCEKELRPWAGAECRRAIENSVPCTCFQASLRFKETYRVGRLWSLYTELWENAAPGSPTRYRWGDTWDIQSGYPVALDNFFPPHSHWKRRLLTLAAEEIERQERRGLSRYCPDWRRRVKRSLNARNYFLTPEGIAFFYPMYALAPAAEGIPTFLCPWDGDAPSAAFR